MGEVTDLICAPQTLDRRTRLRQLRAALVQVGGVWRGWGRRQWAAGMRARVEALEALAMEELGEEPTPEMEQAARDAACYGLDDRALCIGDETDDGTPIPEWAFC
mgnify:CR=1 FL=1